MEQESTRYEVYLFEGYYMDYDRVRNWLNTLPNKRVSGVIGLIK